jgi:carboxyl-terminal processing protease
MGTKSFGKGSVQTIIPLTGHGAMRLTTARYFTPSGGSIQAKGIVPDILAEQVKIEAVDNGPRRSEADLRGALENKGGTDSGTETKAPGPHDKTPQDFQLARALDLLRGLALFNERAVN